MQLKLVDPSKLESLDEYVCMLVTAIMTLTTLKDFQERAVNLGIFKEEHETMANTIVWDIKRLIALYCEQADNLLPMLPDGFSVEEVMQKLASQEISCIKKAISKPRVKKNG